VFGVYDPCASPDLVAFVSRAIELTGRRNAVQVRFALATPLRTAHAPVSMVPADGIEGFLAAIEVLAVPAYDDAIAAPLIAALRAGKSVIVPDPSGAAELIEYGRHGLMFCAGSAYHFANAIDIVSQSWSQRPVLLADGGPAIARTHPSAVAHSFVALYDRLAASDQRLAPQKSSHG
jgi:glycosyltransferase involved in cell wall biosynthesis